MEKAARMDHARESAFLAPGPAANIRFAERLEFFAERPPLWMHSRKS
jgi:hypothetical protein